MIHTVCSVRDAAAGVFGRPLFVAAPGQAIRSFVDEVNRSDGENPLFNHPEDFELHKVGFFDDTKGQLIALESPEVLMRGKDAKKE